MLRGRQAGRRLGGLRDPLPARLVSAHHAGHAGAGLPRGDARQAQDRRGSRDGERQKGAARARPLVDLSTNEIRHLISRLQQLAGLTLEHVLAWSLWRRLHQAAAKISPWKRPRNGTPAHLPTNSTVVLTSLLPRRKGTPALLSVRLKDARRRSLAKTAVAAGCMRR